MRLDREALEATLATLPLPAQGLFALLCAERLRSACWAFGKATAEDVSLYFAYCDRAFAHVCYEAELSEEQIARMVEDLDTQIPRSDDFGDPLAVQAQSGMAALSYCLELLAGGPASLAAEAAAAVVDGLDNFEYATRKALGGADLSPSDYPLLDRELQWQQRMLSALEGGLSVESARRLRRENRAFTLPIAV